ncbi:MAG: hypothetical protein ACR2PH_15625, partial [Desulfobulbia bacterium]
MKLGLLIGVLILSLPAIALETWEQVNHNSAVKVYTKNIPGQAYKSVKAVGIVQAKPTQLLEILN